MKFQNPIFTLLFFFFLNFSLSAQTEYIQEHYTKQEVQIEMRDGVKLHTTIYSPKDTSQKYPIIMKRTPYSSRPYGENEFPRRLGPNPTLMQQGNIFVIQDVRGRWMSEGDYDNMRPFIPNKTGDQIDEASDTYDTIEWLVNNVENNNGNVGIWGISYPGFYATYSLLSRHPALKAVSPQACIADFFFDDFRHNGAFLLSYFRAISVFGYQNEAPTTERWYKFPNFPTDDQYQFFLDNTPIADMGEKYYSENFFWQNIKDHPNYDEFWQKRDITEHLKDIEPAVLIVGGFFDAEDLYGPFTTYETIEKTSDNYNILTYGPWSHGDWARVKKTRQAVGNVFFGEDINSNFQKNVITPFFNHFLKGKQMEEMPEARMFDTGTMEWRSYQEWPPKKTEKRIVYLGDEEKLTSEAEPENVEKFISDPANPVPSINVVQEVVFTPREYMTGDQRFAAHRPDVLVFETEVLEKDVTMVGEILANLKVATTGTDADWIVKLVDVYPPEMEDFPETREGMNMGNYHLMVRSEVMPARFRDGFVTPKPMEPNKKTEIEIVLQGVHHTFKKGHKIQIQIQSSWFPLINLNPQTFVPNIFLAEEADYQEQTHSIFGDSKIEFMVVE
ncbi:MAG TPA: CocE/NonD family hydrolase [Flavobacteriaceae bacterium]|nr:CocE/NonD family hydrolase [Flavobacteriaceae bacterium]